MHGFEELETWKKCRDFRMKISELTKSFPESEKFSLSSQIKRSSRSITNNITEGFGRFHFQENIQFCRVARGSLFETKDHLIIARDENYIDKSTFETLTIDFEVCLKLLNGYIAYLKKSKTIT